MSIFSAAGLNRHSPNPHGVPLNPGFRDLSAKSNFLAVTKVTFWCCYFAEQ